MTVIGGVSSMRMMVNYKYKVPHRDSEPLNIYFTAFVQHSAVQ